MAEDVDKAVQAAAKALKHKSWKFLPGTERGKLMARFADLIEENKELLASIDAWDNGQLCDAPAISLQSLFAEIA